MKTAVVAIDPFDLGTPDLDQFCRTIQMYQARGVLSAIDVICVVHPSEVLRLPHAIHSPNSEVEERIQVSILTQINQKFKFRSVRVQLSSTAEMSESAEVVSKFADSVKAQVLVLGGSNRSLLSYFALGSFAEALSECNRLPILVLREPIGPVTREGKRRMVVAIPAVGSHEDRQIEYLCDLAVSLKSSMTMALSQGDDTNISDWSQVHENLSYGFIRKEFESKGIPTFIRKGEKTCLTAAEVAKISREEEAFLTVFCRKALSEKQPFFKPKLKRQIIYEMTNSFLMFN